MSKVIARLTRTVEVKNVQIATLVNRLEAQHDKNEGPLIDKAEEKLEVYLATMLMRSLSIQQLQEMITSMIKAQYKGNSHDSVLYSKPYSKRIYALRMPRDYQQPKFMQFDGKGNPKQHTT
ncbi:hypothetical protein ACFX12_019427 [Malus domestica]